MLIADNICVQPRFFNQNNSDNNSFILENINFELSPSEIVCLIGPSGCGKTTLLRTLACLQFPVSGKIIVNDKVFSYPSNKKKYLFNSIYPDLSVVFQDFRLWPHISIKKNLLLPIKYNFDSVFFSDIVQFFEIEHLLERFPHEISVGQRQKVAFVRALLLKPKYLLLDEITSAIDIEQIKKLSEFIIIQKKERAIGFLIITHLLGFALNIADRVYYMENGKIIEQGRVSILTNPSSLNLARFLHSASINL